MFEEIKKQVAQVANNESKLRALLEETMRSWADATANIEPQRFSLWMPPSRLGPNGSELKTFMGCDEDGDRCWTDAFLKAGEQDWVDHKGNRFDDAEYCWDFAKIETIVDFFERLPAALPGILEEIEGRNQMLETLLKKVS